MNVSLTPELERWVQSKVDEGLYGSASEVVREGLRGLIERDRQREAAIAELRRELLVAAAELDAGGGVPFDDALFEDIMQRGRARQAAG